MSCNEQTDVLAAKGTQTLPSAVVAMIYATFIVPIVSDLESRLSLKIWVKIFKQAPSRENLRGFSRKDETSSPRQSV